MNEALRLILVGFSIYQISALLALEEGPYSIFAKYRSRLGGDDLGPDGMPDTAIGRLVICPICTSMYVAIPIVILGLWSNYLTSVILIYFGATGFATWLHTSSIGE